MIKEDQMGLVYDLLQTIQTDIFTLIAEGKIPPTWDEIELRELVYERATRLRADRARMRPRLDNYVKHVLLNGI